MYTSSVSEQILGVPKRGESLLQLNYTIQSWPQKKKYAQCALNEVCHETLSSIEKIILRLLAMTRAKSNVSPQRNEIDMFGLAQYTCTGWWDSA